MTISGRVTRRVWTVLGLLGLLGLAGVVGIGAGVLWLRGSEEAAKVTGVISLLLG